MEKTQEQGKVIVTAHYPGDVHKHEERKLEVQTFEVEPARAKASYGLTVGTSKKFEFARIDCGVELPTYREEMPAALKRAWEIAESEVLKQVAEVKRTL
jgi:hypothetical protein